MVTSPYCLTLTEMSDIRNYEGSNYDCYLKLIHLPTKPTAGFISLADVHRKCSSASGKYLYLIFYFIRKCCRYQYFVRRFVSASETSS